MQQLKSIIIIFKTKLLRCLTKIIIKFWSNAPKYRQYAPFFANIITIAHEKRMPIYRLGNKLVSRLNSSQLVLISKISLAKVAKYDKVFC